jgi:hypothetical protein
MFVGVTLRVTGRGWLRRGLFAFEPLSSGETPTFDIGRTHSGVVVLVGGRHSKFAFKDYFSFR